MPGGVYCDPRGEVGAGILILSMGFEVSGPVLTVAMLSLALNLLLTGVFILIVEKLSNPVPASVLTPSAGTVPT